MKKLIYIFFFNFLIISNSFSQLPQDYPFKTLLDEENNLLVTGYDANNDFFVKKFSANSPSFLWTKSFLNPGNDRGMNIAYDSDNQVYATGYVYNQSTNCNDIMLIKFDGTSGNINWTRSYSDGRDSKAFGITMDIDKNIYVAGYVTEKYSQKTDVITIKFSPSGNIVWTNIFGNPDFDLNDAGTHIQIDNNFVYVAGYTDQGALLGKDVFLLSYQLNGKNELVKIYKKAGSNESPTGFIITDYSTAITAKSRVAIGCISDNPATGSNPDFLTLCYGGDAFSTFRWAKSFNGSGNSDDVPTAVATDLNGDVYVTGYSNTGLARNFDFATMKLSKINGDYIWSPNVNYFDTLGGNDKASSIKTGNGGMVFIAGSSDSTQNGYNIKAYKQANSILVYDWSDEFDPDLDTDEPNDVIKKAANVDIDNLGNIYLTVFQWDDNRANYAIRKYNSRGQILFTIDNINNKPGNDANSSENKKTSNRKIKLQEAKD